MTTLTIEGRKVKVSDDFLRLSPEDQADTVDEIASSLGIAAGSGTVEHAPGVTGRRGEGPSSQDEASANIAYKNDFGLDPMTGPMKPDLATTTAQGILMGGADEFASAAAAPFSSIKNRITGDGPVGVKENYDQNLAFARAREAATREHYPKASVATEIFGGLATAPLVAGKVVQGANMLNKAVRGAVAGAGYGAVAGFNSGEGVEDRIDHAKGGAGAGAFLGAAAVPVASGVGKLYQAVASRVSPAVAELAKKAGVTPGAFRRVAEAFDQDMATGSLRTPDKADKVFNLGPAIEAQAEGIAAQPGQGRNILIRTLDAQAKGAPQRVTQATDAALGRDAGRVVNERTIENDRKVAGQLYTIARNYPGKFDVTPLRTALDGEIAAADGPIRSALMRVRNLQLFKDGTVQNANATQLHAARIALDDITQRGTVGPNASRLLKGVRAQIDDVLKKNVPGMRGADDAYAAVMKRGEALEAGRGVFQRQFGSPDELRAELRAMAPAARVEFVKGARDAVSEIMGTARSSASAAKRELFEKGWNAEKLSILLGKNQSTVLLNALEREGARTGAKDRILANSRTALRQEAQRQFPATDRSAKDESGGLTLYGLAARGLGKAKSFLTGERRAELSRQAAMLLSREAQDVAPLLQEASRLRGRRLNVQEQIEVIVSALALASGDATRQNLANVATDPFGAR